MYSNDLKITNKHIQRCSAPVVIRKIKIQTRDITVNWRWLRWKRLTIPGTGKDMEQLNSHTDDRDVKSHHCFGKWSVVS